MKLLTCKAPVAMIACPWRRRDMAGGNKGQTYDMADCGRTFCRLYKSHSLNTQQAEKFE